jgi:hypothetical protein
VTAEREEPEKYQWASGDFGDSTSRTLLVRLAKRAFPNDPEIVELKETKH